MKSVKFADVVDPVKKEPTVKELTGNVFILRTNRKIGQNAAIDVVEMHPVQVQSAHGAFVADDPITYRRHPAWAGRRVTFLKNGDVKQTRRFPKVSGKTDQRACGRGVDQPSAFFRLGDGAGVVKIKEALTNKPN